jgi:hypothetical protein
LGEPSLMREGRASARRPVIDFKKWAPFTTMIVPLAAFIAYLEKKKQINDLQYCKIDSWYWATVFQNRYDEGVNTNTFANFTKIKEWFENDIPIRLKQVAQL